MVEQLSQRPLPVAAAEGGVVKYEDANGVVSPRGIIMHHPNEFIGYWFPHLGREGCVRFCEGMGVRMAAGDENFTVWEDNAVAEARANYSTSG